MLSFEAKCFQKNLFEKLIYMPSFQTGKTFSWGLYKISTKLEINDQY